MNDLVQRARQHLHRAFCTVRTHGTTLQSPARRRILRVRYRVCVSLGTRHSAYSVGITCVCVRVLGKICVRACTLRCSVWPRAAETNETIVREQRVSLFWHFWKFRFNTLNLTGGRTHARTHARTAGRTDGRGRAHDAIYADFMAEERAANATHTHTYSCRRVWRRFADRQ